jgi:hypothetical protein
MQSLASASVYSSDTEAGTGDMHAGPVRPTSLTQTAVARDLSCTPSTHPMVSEQTALTPLTPGQRKAAEAGIRTTSDVPVHQHRDSGYRFQDGTQAGPSQLPLSRDGQVPEELPPVYSES